MEGRAKDSAEVNEARSLDVEEVSILLIGTEQEQNEAVALIDRHLRWIIAGVIRRAAPSLRAEELCDACQDVIVAILEAARKHRYDADQPLLPFIFTLARRKGIDRIRKNSRKIGDGEVLDAIAETLADTKVGEAWRAVAAKQDGRRMMGLIGSAIARLPERQRLVASVVIDLFPELPGLLEIQEEVRKKTGEQLTVVAIKSAWREARKKIRDELVRAGYLEGEDHGDIE